VNGKKHIAVIVRSPDVAKVAEALRGAVGLTLRGDQVAVVLADDAGAPDPRAVATLTSFGYPVIRGSGAIPAAIAAANAIEVWS
jgi:hypothetical protein